MNARVLGWAICFLYFYISSVQNWQAAWYTLTLTSPNSHNMRSVNITHRIRNGSVVTWKIRSTHFVTAAHQFSFMWMIWEWFWFFSPNFNLTLRFKIRMSKCLFDCWNGRKSLTYGIFKLIFEKHKILLKFDNNSFIAQFTTFQTIWEQPLKPATQYESTNKHLYIWPLNFILFGLRTYCGMRLRLECVEFSRLAWFTCFYLL